MFACIYVYNISVSCRTTVVSIQGALSTINGVEHVWPSGLILILTVVAPDLLVALYEYLGIHS